MPGVRPYSRAGSQARFSLGFFFSSSLTIFEIVIATFNDHMSVIFMVAEIMIKTSAPIWRAHPFTSITTDQFAMAFKDHALNGHTDEIIIILMSHGYCCLTKVIHLWSKTPTTAEQAYLFTQICNTGEQSCSSLVLLNDQIPDCLPNAAVLSYSTLPHNTNHCVSSVWAHLTFRLKLTSLINAFFPPRFFKGIESKRITDFRFKLEPARTHQDAIC